MTDAPQISPQQAAQAELDGLVANPEWGQKFMANDAATLEQFQKLTTTIASENESDPTQSLEAAAEATRSKQFNDAVDFFAASNDLPPEVVADIKAGGKVSAEEHKLAQAWLDRHTRDREWSRRLLDGDGDAARQFALCNVILAAEIDPNKTIKRAS